MIKNVRNVLLPKKWATSKKSLPIIGGAYIEAPIIGLGGKQWLVAHFILAFGQLSERGQG